MMSSVPLSLEKGSSHLTFVKRPKKEIYGNREHRSCNFSRNVRKTQTKNTEEWLDNQDVCTLLKISPRTLQNLRNNGSIPYTRIERKIFYNKRDIWNFIEERNIQSNKRV